MVDRINNAKVCIICYHLKDENCFRKIKKYTCKQCKSCQNLKQKQYKSNNKEYYDNYNKLYYQNNKENINEYQKVYRKTKRQVNVNFKLRSNISTIVNKVLYKINSSKNGKSIIQFLPYTFQELKDHLEKQFEPWMNWNNYGVYKVNTWDDNDQFTWVWNIDHIIPQSDLPYKSMEEENFKKCWALDNLRPYSAKQNRLDGNRKSK